MTEGQTTVGLNEEQTVVYKAGVLYGQAQGLSQAAKSVRAGADQFEAEGVATVTKSQAKTKAGRTQLQAVKQVAAGMRSWAAELDNQANAARINAGAQLSLLAQHLATGSLSARAGTAAGKAVASVVAKFVR